MMQKHYFLWVPQVSIFSGPICCFTERIPALLLPILHLCSTTLDSARASCTLPSRPQLLVIGITPPGKTEGGLWAPAPPEPRNSSSWLIFHIFNQSWTLYGWSLPGMKSAVYQSQDIISHWRHFWKKSCPPWLRSWRVKDGITLLSSGSCRKWQLTDRVNKSNINKNTCGHVWTCCGLRISRVSGLPMLLPPRYVYRSGAAKVAPHPCAWCWGQIAAWTQRIKGLDGWWDW